MLNEERTVTQIDLIEQQIKITQDINQTTQQNQILLSELGNLTQNSKLNFFKTQFQKRNDITQIIQELQKFQDQEILNQFKQSFQQITGLSNPNEITILDDSNIANFVIAEAIFFKEQIVNEEIEFKQIQDQLEQLTKNINKAIIDNQNEFENMYNEYPGKDSLSFQDLLPQLNQFATIANSHLNLMEKLSNQIQQFQQDQNIQIQDSTQIYQQKLQQAQQNYSKLQDEYKKQQQSLQAKINQFQKQIDDLNSDKQLQIIQIDQLNDQISVLKATSEENMKKQGQELKQAIDQISDNLKSQQQKNQKLSSEINNLKNQEGQLRQKYDSQSSQLKTVTQQYEQQIKQLQELEQKYTNQLNEIKQDYEKQLKQEQDGMEKERVNLLNKQNEQQNKINQLQNLQKSSKELQEQLTQSKNQLQQSLENETSARQDIQQKLQEMQSKNQQLQLTFDTNNKNIESLKQQISDIEQEKIQIQLQLQQQQESFQQLQKENHEFVNNIVKQQQQSLSSQQNINLQQLIQADPKYREQNQRLQELQSQHNQLLRQNKQTQQLKELSEQTIKQLEQEFKLEKQNLQQNIDKLQQEFDSKNNTIQELNQRLTQQQNQINQLQNNEKQLNDQLQDQINQLKDKSQQINKLQQQILLSNQDLNNATLAQNHLKSEINQLKLNIQQSDGIIEQMKSQISTSQEILDRITDIQSIKNQDELEQQIIQIPIQQNQQQQLEIIKNNLSEKIKYENEINNLQIQFDNLQLKLDNFKKENMNLKKSKQDIQQELSQQNIQLKFAMNEKQELTRKLESINNQYKQISQNTFTQEQVNQIIESNQQKMSELQKQFNQLRIQSNEKEMQYLQKLNEYNKEDRQMKQELRQYQQRIQNLNLIKQRFNELQESFQQNQDTTEGFVNLLSSLINLNLISSDTDQIRQIIQSKAFGISQQERQQILAENMQQINQKELQIKELIDKNIEQINELEQIKKERTLLDAQNKQLQEEITQIQNDMFQGQDLSKAQLAELQVKNTELQFQVKELTSQLTDISKLIQDKNIEDYINLQLQYKIESIIKPLEISLQQSANEINDIKIQLEEYKKILQDKESIIQQQVQQILQKDEEIKQLRTQAFSKQLFTNIGNSELAQNIQSAMIKGIDSIQSEELNQLQLNLSEVNLDLALNKELIEIFPDGIPLHVLYLLAKSVLNKNKNKTLNIFVPQLLEILKAYFSGQFLSQNQPLIFNDLYKQLTQSLNKFDNDIKIKISDQPDILTQVQVQTLDMIDIVPAIQPTTDILIKNNFEELEKLKVKVMSLIQTHPQLLDLLPRVATSSRDLVRPQLEVEVDVADQTGIEQEEDLITETINQELLSDMDEEPRTKTKFDILNELRALLRNKTLTENDLASLVQPLIDSLVNQKVQSQINAQVGQQIIPMEELARGRKPKKDTQEQQKSQQQQQQQLSERQRLSQEIEQFKQYSQDMLQKQIEGQRQNEENKMKIQKAVEEALRKGQILSVFKVRFCNLIYEMKRTKLFNKFNSFQWFVKLCDELGKLAKKQEQYLNYQATI